MDFAAVAHDLRGPLNAMLGHMQLLATEGVSDKARRRLQVIEAQIHRMVMLLESCTPNPEQPRRIEPVDLTAAVHSVVAELEGTCERRRIKVIVSSEQSLQLVDGDANELHRLLMNLFTNAADAMPNGGRLLVRVRQRRTRPVPTAAICVTDSGMGIPPDVVPRVFARGFTTKPPGQGTGLGLAICQEIVRAHGGAIHLRSTVGRGTTVRVRLPVSR
jgi:two-component system, LuxR family, sensor kinase FixL